MIKILLCAALMFPAFANGAEQRIQCPARYPTEMVRLSELPRGWNGQGQVRAMLPLLGAGFVVGSIAENSKAELIGSGATKTKDGFESRFVTGPTKEERWIFCSYGNAGSIELYHRVATDATQCVIKTKTPEFPADPQVHIVCK